MVALLAAEKQRLLRQKGHVTRQDFDRAWTVCWEAMRKEHAWAHQTRHRRGSRSAMLSTRSEYRAAFLDEPTAFALAIGRLSGAASNMCLRLEPGQTVTALLAAIAYVDADELRAA